MELMTWLVQNAEDTGIVTYLVVTLVIVGFGLYRKWWVIGWQYQDAITSRDAALRDRDDLRDRIDERAERVERKLEIFEEAERLAKPRPRSRTSGSSS